MFESTRLGLLATLFLASVISAHAAQPAFTNLVNDDNNSTLFRVFEPAESLSSLIKRHRERAARYKQRFYLLLTTSSCGACKTMFRNWQHHSMTAAVQGTYILSLNARHFDFSKMHLRIKAVPAFIKIAPEQSMPHRIYYGFGDTNKLAKFLHQ